MQSSVFFTRRGISHVLTLALLMTCLGVIAPATILAVDPVDKNQQLEIGKVIEQLKSGRFNERETASRQLAEFGRAAIGPLTEAAMSKQREVTMRAIDILKKHLASTDAETRQAAKAALEQVAAGPQASAARQAQQVLNPPAEPEPEAAPPAGRIQVFGGPIQIRVQAGVAGNQRIRIKQVNGTREIEAEENGRKVTIKEDQKNGIQMEVTEKKDGKETTKKYAAKNADELAKKHPDAHKLYKKYTDQPKFNFKFPNLQQAIPLVPGKNQLPPNFRLPPGLIPQQAQRSLEKANQELDKSIKELEEATKELKIETKDAEKLRRILDQLKSSRKKLNQAQSQLGGR
ncbi:MAG: hypothetical protein VB857_06700 [Pirellulaceae bacterium]